MTPQMIALFGASAVAFAYISRKAYYTYVSKRIEEGKRAVSASTYFDPAILSSSSKWGVDPKVVKSIIYWESSFDPKKTSPAGAYGLGQFVRDTWNWVWRNIIGQMPRPITDPMAHIEAVSAYLRHLLDRFNGNYVHAISAYNLGPTRVLSILRRAPDTASFIKELPFETKAYVYAITELIPYARV